MPNRDIHPTRYLPAVPAYEQPAHVRGLTPAETRTLAQILSSAPTPSLDQQAFAPQPGAATAEGKRAYSRQHRRSRGRQPTALDGRGFRRRELHC